MLGVDSRAGGTNVLIGVAAKNANRAINTHNYWKNATNPDKCS